MAKVIQDLWILTEGGIVIFKRVFDANVNAQLFGGLMSALHSFAQELASGGLTNFELSDVRFTILKSIAQAKSFLFIANSSKKIKEKKVQEELKKISDRFFEKYPDIDWDNWDGGIDIFENFEDNISDTLEDPIKKFWSGLVT